MANTVIQLKKSGQTGNVPSSLNFGELAINYQDGKLFYKNGTSAIVSFAAGGNSFSTVNANSILILATSTTDTLSFIGSNTINVVGNSTTKQVTISSNTLTGLTPGAYTNSNITVDIYGRVIAAASGSAGTGGTTNTAVYLSSFTGTGAQTVYQLSNPTTNNTATQVFINGVYEMSTGGAYTFSGNTITFTEAPYAGANIEVLSFIPSNTTVVQVASFNGRTGAITLTAADINSAGGNANIASDIIGGSANQILYQASGNNTQYLTAPSVANTYLYWDSNNGGFKWGTVAATGSGNATYANIANIALISVNQQGGVANQIPYQTAANTTSFIGAPTVNNSILSWVSSSGGLVWSTYTIESVTSGITAAGSSQGTATALTSSVNEVNAGSGGVILPPAIIGRRLVVYNDLATTLTVYPPVSGQIDAALTNIGVSIAAGSQAEYIGITATQYETLRPSLIAGTNITITPGNGIVTIASSGSGAATGNGVVYLSSYTANGTTSGFLLTNPAPNTTMVFINGVYQMFSTGAYTLTGTGNTVTFSENPPQGSQIETISFVTANAVTIVPVTSYNGRTGAIVSTIADFSSAAALGAVTSNVAFANAVSFTGSVTSANVTTISGGLTVSNTTNHSGNVQITNTAISSSATTGALTVAGGVGISGNTTLANSLYLPASTLTIAPLFIPPTGALAVTPSIGAFEANVNTLYYSSNTATRSVIPTMFYYRNNSANTLASSLTTQPWLGGLGGVTVGPAMTYEFEGEFNLVTSGTTSHTESLLFTLTTATLTNIGYSIVRSPTGTTGTQASNSFYATAATAIATTTAITTAQNVNYRIRGTLTTVLGGKIRPDIIFSAAPGGTSTITLGAWFRMMPLGPSANNVAIGLWS